MSRLAGKVALVTGAAQGIGRVLARGLAREGAAVAIADVLDGTAAADEIAGAGGRAIALPCDVSDPEAVRGCVSGVVERLGRLDAVVNNAALFGKVQNVGLFDIRVEDWDRMMAVNVRGPWLVMREAARAMAANGGGSIVNIATNRIFQGSPMLLHYDASKGAVLAMTRSAARELGELNVRVNAIAPGLTMSENVRTRDGIADRAPQIAARRALKRDQQPEDLVGAAVFLASEDSAFMTGQCLVVDGGGVMN